MTAHAMKEDRDRCLAAGMDGYVSKPIEQVKLRQAIEDCVLGVGKTAPDGGTGSPFDAAAALARVDGDWEFLGEMAAMFLEESPRLLAQIQEAIAADDHAGLVAPAHNLKNWTANFAAPEAFEAVANLEALGRAGALANAETAFATVERTIEKLRRAMDQFAREPASLIGDGNPAAVTNHSGSLPCTL
jgi:two-component system, sensor histidine kinase and response regulator